MKRRRGFARFEKQLHLQYLWHVHLYQDACIVTSGSIDSMHLNHLTNRHFQESPLFNYSDVVL